MSGKLATTIWRTGLVLIVTLSGPLGAVPVAAQGTGVDGPIAKAAQSARPDPPAVVQDVEMTTLANPTAPDGPENEVRDIRNIGAATSSHGAMPTTVMDIPDPAPNLRFGLVGVNDMSFYRGPLPAGDRYDLAHESGATWTRWELNWAVIEG